MPAIPGQNRSLLCIEPCIIIKTRQPFLHPVARAVVKISLHWAYMFAAIRKSPVKVVSVFLTINTNRYESIC